jgi:hypothetical protein
MIAPKAGPPLSRKRLLLLRNTEEVFGLPILITKRP